jgi:hypothetical protein
MQGKNCPFSTREETARCSTDCALFIEKDDMVQAQYKGVCTLRELPMRIFDLNQQLGNIAKSIQSKK